MKSMILINNNEKMVMIVTKLLKLPIIQMKMLNLAPVDWTLVSKKIATFIQKLKSLKVYYPMVKDMVHSIKHQGRTIKTKKVQNLNNLILKSELLPNTAVL